MLMLTYSLVCEGDYFLKMNKGKENISKYHVLYYASTDKKIVVEPIKHYGASITQFVMKIKIYFSRCVKYVKIRKKLKLS